MIAAVAIFCEDIREEKSGQDTIIGTLPDNMQIAGVPPTASAKTILPRLGVFIRVCFGVEDHTPNELSAKVLNTTGATVSANVWEPSVIQRAFAEARANKLPLVGFISKMVIGNFPVGGPGRIVAIVTMDGVDYLCGAINVIIPPLAPTS